MNADENDHWTCPWPWCQCTHVGCVSGWIERRRDDGSEYADPCPTCRPEVARHLANREKSLMRLRRELPALPRPTRTRNMAGAVAGQDEPRRDYDRA